MESFHCRYALFWILNIPVFYTDYLCIMFSVTCSIFVWNKVFNKKKKEKFNSSTPIRNQKHCLLQNVSRPNICSLWFSLQSILTSKFNFMHGRFQVNFLSTKINLLPFLPTNLNKLLINHRRQQEKNDWFKTDCFDFFLPDFTIGDKLTFVFCGLTLH